MIYTWLDLFPPFLSHSLVPFCYSFSPPTPCVDTPLQSPLRLFPMVLDQGTLRDA